MHLRNFAVLLLVVLLLKNLGIVNWQSGRPQLEAEQTRQNVVNTIGGSVRPELAENDETEDDAEAESEADRQAEDPYE